MGKTFSGKRLREAREALGVSRQALAQALDFSVGPAVIYQYEKVPGKEPRVSVASRMAEVLGIELGDLLEDQVEPDTPDAES